MTQGHVKIFFSRGLRQEEYKNIVVQSFPRYLEIFQTVALTYIRISTMTSFGDTQLSILPERKLVVVVGVVVVVVVVVWFGLVRFMAYQPL